MAPIGDGIGDGKAFDGKETGRDFWDKDRGSETIVQKQVAPGDHIGDTAPKDVPSDVRQAGMEFDSLYTADPTPKPDPAPAPMGNGLSEFFGNPVQYVKDVLSIGEPTHVDGLDARRTSAADPILSPWEHVQMPDGEVRVIQRGQAEFVDVETVKQRVGQIENEVSWSESYERAVSRKATQLEPDLYKQYKADFKKQFIEKDKMTDADADKAADRRAKTLAKEDARKQAVDWYKDASLRRRQAVDKRTAELLPDWQRKFPKNPDMAKYQAERQAKAEWDKQIKDAKDDLPVILDTSIPGMGFGYLRVIDHHGAFLRKADGSVQKANATMQLMNRFEDALRAAGATDVNHPTDAQVTAAMRLMNLKQVSTDNLADGAWSVWMSQHQAEVLKDPSLRSMIRQATYFEDFTAFSQGKYDRNDPAVELQAALFSEYGRILDKYGVKGSDRIPADKADAIMKETMAAMDKMVYDPAARAQAADGFWKNVDALRAKTDQAVLYEAKGPDGRTLMKFYDMTKLPGTVFEQWLAVPDAYRERPLLNADGSLKLDDQGHPIMGPGDSLNVQVTVAPMPDGRTLPIVAIPYGNKVGNRAGLLSVLDALNKAEKAKADALGVPANFWFGKDSVVLPNPAGGGSRLTPKEIADIVTDPKFHLFDQKDASPSPQLGTGAGVNLTTTNGQVISPLNPHYITDVTGFTAQRSYRDASKLIDDYGVGRDGTPRAKGERLSQLATLGRDANGVGGDPRAKEALDLLYQMKADGNQLIFLSEQKADPSWIDTQAASLAAKTARFKTLVGELGLDGNAGVVGADKRPALKDRAAAADAEYTDHRKFNDSPGHADGTQVEYLRDAEAWVAQGNPAQKAAARDVLAAAESNRTVLQDINALEKGMDSYQGDEKVRAEKALDDLYGVLDRNMKVVDRWKSYLPERKEFDLAIAKFEVPYIGSALIGGMKFLGFELPAPLGVVDVTTRSPEYYEDLNGGVGKQPGDYAVTIWVRTPADQSRILGDIWKDQNPNNVKWGRDAQGRYLRVVDSKGREMDVHVQVVTPDQVASKPAPQKPGNPAQAPQLAAHDDAIPQDLAAKRVSKDRRTDVTVPGK